MPRQMLQCDRKTLESKLISSKLYQIFRRGTKYVIKSIKNYIYLSQVMPEMFPNQLQVDQESLKIENIEISIAMRLMTHFERRGLNM